LAKGDVSVQDSHWQLTHGDASVRDSRWQLTQGDARINLDPVFKKNHFRAMVCVCVEPGVPTI
jgi:hypothetical protein